MPRWAWALVALFLLGLAIYELKNVLTPIFLAFLIAYFLDPLVDRFEERGVPRALGIALLLTLVLLGFALILLLVVPGVVREVAAFGEELPGHIERGRAALEPLAAQYGVELPRSFDDVRHLLGLDEASSNPNDSRAGLASQVTPILKTIAGWLWGGTTSLVGVLGTTFLVPVFAFYLLYDFDRMTAGVRDLVPLRFRPFVVDVAREIDQVLGQFVRGQLLVMLILAVLYAIAYSLAGVRLAVPIGIVAGLLSFIPYVGGAAAILLALLMCALGFEGWWQVAGVVIGYGIIQALESFVITPRIVGDKVGLPAIWVLVALLLGGELFGFLGVLLALPAAAVAKIFVVRAVAYYRQTPLYTGGASPDVADGLPGVLAVEGLPDEPELAIAKREAIGAPEHEQPDGDAPADLEEAIASALASIPPPPASEPDEPSEPDADEPVLDETVPDETVPDETAPPADPES